MCLMYSYLLKGFKVRNQETGKFDLTWFRSNRGDMIRDREWLDRWAPT